ncbi:unnamed protein product [Ixodes pacificus]
MAKRDYTAKGIRHIPPAVGHRNSNERTTNPRNYRGNVILPTQLKHPQTLCTPKLATHKRATGRLQTWEREKERKKKKDILRLTYISQLSRHRNDGSVPLVPKSEIGLQ